MSGKTDEATRLPPEDAAKGDASRPDGSETRLGRESTPEASREPAKAKAASKEKKTEAETEAEAANRRTSNFKTIAGAVALAIFIRVVLFEAFMIDGPSMEPTLQDGDRVVVAKYAFGLFLPGMHEAIWNWSSPNAGDVVIVNSPMDGVDIVKRVIGVPGDRVEIREDEVFVNGESILRRVLGSCPEDETTDEVSECQVWEEGIGERTWRSSHDPHDTESMSVREVPEGHVLVLGDHRNRSNDSRNPLVGMIPFTHIKGRALSIYWSSSDEGMRWDRMFTNIR
jgi:signal peptidase I